MFKKMITGLSLLLMITLLMLGINLKADEPTELELARANPNPELVSKEFVNASLNIRADHEARVKFDGEKMTDGAGAEWFRTAKIIHNSYLDARTVSVGGVEVDTSTLDTYLSAIVQFSSVEQSELIVDGAVAGIIIGFKNDGTNTTYFTVSVRPWYSTLFLYAFVVDNATGQAIAEAADDIHFSGILGEATNDPYHLEVLTKPTGINLYLNGETIGGTITAMSGHDLTNMTPIIGMNSCGAPSTVKNFEMKYLNENLEMIFPEQPKTAELTSTDLGASVDKIGEIEKNQAGEFLFDNSTENFYFATEPKTQYWAETNVPGQYELTSATSLSAFMSFKFKYDGFADPTQDYFGAGMVFRADDNQIDRYAVRMLQDKILLMNMGTPIASVLNPLKTSEVYEISILTTKNSVTVWINDRIVFDNFPINEGVPHKMAVWNINSNLIVEDLEYNIINGYDENPNPSTDNTLSDLQFEGVTVNGFESSKTDYEITLPVGSVMPNVSSVTYIINDSLSTAVINKQENVISVIVTAEDGSTKTYSIIFDVLLSTDAFLTEIKVSGFLLPDYDKNEVIYTYGYKDTKPVKENVTFTKSDNNANVEVTSVDNKILLVVTAEDGTTTKTYTINLVYIESSDADLVEIKIAGIAIENFDKDTLTYTINLPAGQRLPGEETITYLKSDNKAAVTITIQVTAFTLKVVAEDNTEKSYVLTFILNLSSNSALSSLSVKEEKISDFSATVFEYTHKYKNERPGISDIEYVLSHQGATANVSLDEDENILIVVTAEDDSTSTYKIIFDEVKNAPTDGVLVAVIIGSVAVLGIVGYFIVTIIRRKKV